MAPRGLALLILLALLWSGGFTLTKIGVTALPPATLVAARLWIAAAVLWLALAAGGGRLPPIGPAWRLYALLAATGNVAPFLLISWGQMGVDSGLAAILIGTTPLITLALAPLVGRDERSGAPRIAGIGLGFVAIVVLFAPRLAGASGGIMAPLALIAGAGCYALNMLLTRRVGHDLVAAATAVTLLAAMLSLPLALLMDQPWHLRPDLAAVATVFALGAFATALATIVFFRLVRDAGATATSTVNYLIPGLGVLWGVLFLGERPGWAEGLALVLIVAALVLVNRGSQPRKPSTSAMP